MGLEIEIPAELQELFKGNLPETMEAILETNLEYMMPLEGITKDGGNRPGHSPQAPQGMVRINLPQIESNFAQAVNEAMEAIARGENPLDALDDALVDGIMFAAREIVTDTPIDTGLARASWRVVLPDKSEMGSVELGFAEPAKPKEESKHYKPPKNPDAPKRTRKKGGKA